jgi:hypothetical protein
MTNLIVCTVTLFFLTGCTVDFGVTERTQIRANAQVQVAQADQAAREAEAQAIVDAEATRQAGLNRRYATIAFITPFIVLAIGLVLILLLIINWRGRIAFEQAKALAVPATASLPPALVARMGRNGYEPQIVDGVWWPVNKSTGKLFSKPIPQHILEVK